MSVLITPELDKRLWPTLGPQVCDFIENYLVFGPGDLRGEPAVLDAEKRGLIHRMYEVYPRKHPEAGRRRFRRVAISLRKGSAKTEFAAWLAAAELHHTSPVRCVGWDGDEPIGGPVNDPYIPLVAYTEEQSEELCYGALHAILSESPIADDFDIGLTRIMRLNGAGKAVALAGAPGARDGARTTFQVFDETHRMTLDRLRQAHRTMLANLPKRKLADAWSLETTTAYSPGEGSVAEDTMDYAREVAAGKIKDSKLFFFHRQASEKHDLETPEGRLAAVKEASGPVAEWSDLTGIVDQWQDPKADPAFLERVWLNRPVKSSGRAFDVEKWRGLADPRGRPAPGTLITLGFDGARNRDSTSLVGTEVATGYQFLLGLWERPVNAPADWSVPIGEVREAVADAFAKYEVWRLYADPPYWETVVDEWAGEYPDRAVAWYTNRTRPMAYAVQAFHNAIAEGEVSHDGDEDLARHIGNAAKHELTLRDNEGKRLWYIQKERPDSPHKIDAAMAAILSWEARRDAVQEGMLNQPEEGRVYVFGGSQEDDPNREDEWF